MNILHLRKKIKQAERMLDVLACVSPQTTQRPERYYKVLRLFQQARKALNDELRAAIQPINLSCSIDIVEYNRAVKENMVTSTTYEKAKKRMHKNINDRFKNR